MGNLDLKPQVDLVILEASLGIIENFDYFATVVIKYIQGISMTM